MTGFTECIIKFRFSPFIAIASLFFSSPIWALGFGEITLHSRIGEPLSAEVLLHGHASQQISTTCFSLTPLPNAELPVVAAASIRLIRTGQNFRLLISGRQAMTEPIFLIGLRAACGVDLRRDYILMPAAPLAPDSHQPNTPSPAVNRISSQKTVNFQRWPADDGDTLESIAEAQAPNNPTEQQRLLNAMQRANPDLRSSKILSRGTLVRIPNLIQPPPTPPDTGEARPTPRPARTVQQSKLAGIDQRGTDRLSLGSEPESFKTEQAERIQQHKLSEIEGQMLRLETTLHTLSQQVDNLNTALEVTAEATLLRQKLQAVQAEALGGKQSSSTPIETTHIASASNQTGISNWLELLLSALAGGGLSAGIAHLLERRRIRRIEATRPT